MQTEPRPALELSIALGLKFKNITFLELACVHKSYGNENRGALSIDVRDNERMEFLGDAILDLAISKLLLEEFPDAPEGDLSKLRAALVNEKTLSVVARTLELGDYVWLGKGEELTGGKDKDSILASTLEAIVAAVFLDGGFEAADEWLRRLFNDQVKEVRVKSTFQDFKTKLQEVVQARFKTAPRYELLDSTGPDHDKTFSIRLIVNGKELAKATGKSKKQAEQSAAELALEILGSSAKIR